MRTEIGRVGHQRGARARLRRVQVDEHHGAEHRLALDLAASVQVREVGDAVRPVDLDVLGTGIHGERLALGQRRHC